jgi:prepilin-type processing-associated H-X9-DG protein
MGSANNCNLGFNEDPFNTGNGDGNYAGANVCMGVVNRGYWVPASGIVPWSAKLSDITDGTSNTIMMGEVRQACISQTWISWGWADTEALWYATTAPINYPCCPDDLAVDTASNPCTWYRTANAQNWNSFFGFKSKHTGGAHFALCDGSVRFISQNIDINLYQRLGAKSDGQVISGDY